MPGFALVCAVLPDRQLSRGERLLASVGMSLAITVCAAVALAAAPVGLSRQSIAVALGVVHAGLFAVHRGGTRILSRSRVSGVGY